MAQAGRKPKPVALKVLEGNPGKRALPGDIPKTDEKPPACPSWLLAEAKKEWRRVCPILHELGLLKQVDRTALAGYCQAYARWRQAEEKIGKRLTYGYTNKAGARNKLAKPEISMAQRYLDQVKSFCAEFGLTPSSRSRMTLPGVGDEEDPMEQILKDPNRRN